MRITSGDIWMLVSAMVYAALVRLRIPVAVRNALKRSWWSRLFGRSKPVAIDFDETFDGPAIRIEHHALPAPPTKAVEAVLRRTTRLRFASAAIYVLGAFAAALTLTAIDREFHRNHFDAPTVLHASLWPVCFIALWVAIPSRLSRGVAALVLFLVWATVAPQKNWDTVVPFLTFFLFLFRSFTTLVPLSFAGFLSAKVTYTSFADRVSADDQVLLIVGSVLAGAFVIHAIGNLYERRVFSDVSLSVCFLWIIFGVLNLRGRPSDEWTTVAIALVAYALTTSLLFAILRPIVRRRVAAPLLILRVFDARGRARRLFNEIGSQWRFLGPVQALAGTDSAATNLDPGEAARFLLLRKRSVYIRSARKARKRLAERRDLIDRNGRYRINDFFCSNDTWEQVLRGVLDEATAIVIDLSRFNSTRAGIQVELTEVFARKRLSQCVFLTDDTTNDRELNETIVRLWSNVPESSPNLQGRPVIRIFKNKTPDELMPEIIAAAMTGGWNPSLTRDPSAVTAAPANA